MIEIHVPVDVPESRKVIVTLPPEVPTGPNELTVRVHEPKPVPLEVRIDPEHFANPRQRNDKWWQEYQAFLRLLPDLLKTLRGQYVAVHEGQVVDSDREKIPLACRVFQTYGKVPMCVRLVAEQLPPPVRLPSFRVIKNGER